MGKEPDRFRSQAYLDVLDTEPCTRTVLLPGECARAMRVHAEQGYPLEVCGLLLGRIDDAGWHVTDVRPVANLHQERASDRFVLDPDAYRDIERQAREAGIEIIGVYHSHPDCPARPSPTDQTFAWEDFLYPIIRVDDGRAIEIACWALNAEGKRFQRVEAVCDKA